MSKKLRNKLIKMYNGNGQLRHSISILQWNAGNKHWKRKLEIIEALTLEKAPDLLFITEANLMADTTEEQRRIPGYNMFLPLTLETLKYARIVLLVREGIEVKLLSQHMAVDLSTIWVKLGQAGRKPLVVAPAPTHCSKRDTKPDCSSRTPAGQMEEDSQQLEGSSKRGEMHCDRRHESGLLQLAKP